MERLTRRNADGSVSQPTDLRWADALPRLADYEDTGLTPEGIKDIVEMFHAYRHICHGFDPSRLEALTKAEKDGRLVVLPCKIGDTLFDTTMGDIKELTVKSIPMMLYPHGLHIGLNATNYRGAFLLIEMWQIGKTIFSTREEAEAALERMKEEGND